MAADLPVRVRLAAALAARTPGRIPDSACEARAAVTLILRPDAGHAGIPSAPDAGHAGIPSAPDAGGPGIPSLPGAGSPGIPSLPGEPSLLLVQRAEFDTDPWSGHMALPGGRREPADTDLAATAIRETREETSLRLTRSDLLGALDDVHPFTCHLPSIAVTPFVAWYEGEDEVSPSAELRDYIWVPVSALRAPERRSAFTLRSGDRVASFPTFELEGRTVWGLTFEIVSRFLEVYPPPE